MRAPRLIFDVRVCCAPGELGHIQPELRDGGPLADVLAGPAALGGVSAQESGVEHAQALVLHVPVGALAVGVRLCLRALPDVLDPVDRLVHTLQEAGCAWVGIEDLPPAVFATPATVASRAFQRELAFRAIGVDVEAQACGGVVDAIEDGDFILAEAMVRSHVDALKRKMPNPEAAILGCTHYPLMAETFTDALGAGVKVYSQAQIVAESLADYLERHPKIVGAGQESKYLTTGDPQTVSSRATQFLKREIKFVSA